MSGAEVDKWIQSLCLQEALNLVSESDFVNQLTIIYCDLGKEKKGREGFIQKLRAEEAPWDTPSKAALNSDGWVTLHQAEC